MSSQTDKPYDDFDDADDVLSAAISSETSQAERSRSQRFWEALLASRDMALLVIGIILIIFFALAAPDTFLTRTSIFNTVRNVALIGIVAVGMAYLMIAGEIDLSVGSTLGFVIIVFGVMVVQNKMDIWLAAGLALLLGALIGLANGLIVTKLGIPSFIVTLAMLAGYRSLTLVVSEQRPYAGDGVGPFYSITGGYIGEDVPVVIIWMLIVTLIGGVLLWRSRFGYHVYAVGGNLEAARNSGIKTDRVKILCFALLSGLCAVAALLLFGSQRLAEPTAGTGFEFRVIGAVIVGGVALTGGRGTILGVFIGTVIIGVITSGLTQLGLSQSWGDVATGVLIVGVGTLDLVVRHVASRRLAQFDI